MAIFFACFCSKSNDENREANEWLDDNCVDLNCDEEYLHENKVCLCCVYDEKEKKNERENFDLLKRMKICLHIEIQYVQID